MDSQGLTVAVMLSRKEIIEVAEAWLGQYDHIGDATYNVHELVDQLMLEGFITVKWVGG